MSRSHPPGFLRLPLSRIGSPQIRIIHKLGNVFGRRFFSCLDLNTCCIHNAVIGMDIVVIDIRETANAVARQLL